MSLFVKRINCTIEGVLFEISQITPRQIKSLLEVIIKKTKEEGNTELTALAIAECAEEVLNKMIFVDDESLEARGESIMDFPSECVVSFLDPLIEANKNFLQILESKFQVDLSRFIPKLK